MSHKRFHSITKLVFSVHVAHLPVGVTLVISSQGCVSYFFFPPEQALIRWCASAMYPPCVICDSSQSQSKTQHDSFQPKMVTQSKCAQ